MIDSDTAWIRENDSINYHYKMKVNGGWIYRFASTPFSYQYVFVPDKEIERIIK